MRKHQTREKGKVDDLPKPENHLATSLVGDGGQPEQSRGPSDEHRCTDYTYFPLIDARKAQLLLPIIECLR